MSHSKENEDTVLVWTVITGEEIGGEEPHLDYPDALQALIYEAESYLQEFQKNPQLEPRPIGLFCKREPAEDYLDI